MRQRQRNKANNPIITNADIVPATPPTTEPPDFFTGGGVFPAESLGDADIIPAGGLSVGSASGGGIPPITISVVTVVKDAEVLRNGDVWKVVGAEDTTGAQEVAERLDVEVEASGLGTTAKGVDVDLANVVCCCEVGDTGACVVAT